MKRLILNLRKADGYVKTETDILIETLESAQMYNSRLLYTAVDGFRIEELLKEGSYRKGKNTIFAFKHDELSMDCSSTENSLGVYLYYYNDPAIAIYDARHLVNLHDTGEFRFKYQDKKFEALVGIVKLIT